MSELQKRVERMRAERRGWTFTLEAGRGETYSHSRPVLYGHNEYPHSSVLAGRPLRQWLATWDTWEAARDELTWLDYDEIGGSTHIPVDDMTRGL